MKRIVTCLMALGICWVAGCAGETNPLNNGWEPLVLEDTEDTDEAGGGKHQTNDDTDDDDAPLVEPIYLINRWAISEAALQSELEELGFKVCHMLTQRHADPGKTGTIDRELLREDLDHIIPEDAEYAMLDIETPYYGWLEEEVGSPHWTQAKNELLAAMAIARELRPNTKWTFYGLPGLRYWIVDDEGNNRNRHTASEELIAQDLADQIERFTVLIDQCDWVNPSLYDHWKNDEMEAPGETALKTEAWYKAEVALAKLLGGDKTILPAVWHRFHDSTQWQYIRIPKEEFASDQLWYALEEGAEGFFYWAADPAHLKTQVPGYLVQPEFEGLSEEQDLLDVADQLHREYSEHIISTTDHFCSQ